MDFARSCVSGLLALAVCGCGGSGKETTDDASAAARTASAGERAQARAYVGRFATGNPDVCFREVGLTQPALEARSGEGGGPRVPPVRVVVAIDGSGSMAGRIGGQTKLDLAREAATRFVDGLPASVEASLLVFGQQGDNSAAGKARSCAGIDVLAPMSNDRAQLGAAVSRVRAVGWTPLAAGLAKAEALLARSATEGAQIIYVVSDGEETCGGDPVAAARRINSGATRAIVNIIGFSLPSGEAAALKAVSDAGGGSFVNLNSRADYDQTLARLREANRQSGNVLRQSNAVSGNVLRTSNATSSATLCISNMISSETLRMSNDLSARVLRKEGLPFRSTAEGLLKERHDAMRGRLERYRARLQGDEARTRDTIDAAADAVR
ncbi:Ca-activated chloride channel family protein [Sphingomonas naasensis]|uniref:VWA domain-containing protein n=1 Tax=Sphingomonas naasensis TaxID=1344951 RepID=A0A4S1WVB8_9SPHN|nr:VWA domain-containing protein [Sphingomonas naasensis]NIJ18980.1 Ca-activated chloride channel family protein [Sphingomonas naasensis]TGX46190.1 VWA domain-containing protein [Sphingomonas naasensis]